MEILRPASTFEIIWLDNDPLESTVWFPQVTIKIFDPVDNPKSVGPFDLESEGSGRYTYPWKIPNDRTGQGTEIDMTLKVYTDSGHTNLAAQKAQENRVYNIWDLAALMRGGGGGNSYRELKGIVDYEKINKMIKENIGLIVIPDVTKKFVDMADQINEQGEKIILGAKTDPEPTKKLQTEVTDLKEKLNTISRNSETLIKIFEEKLNTSQSENVKFNQGLLEGFQNSVMAIGTQINGITKSVKEYNGKGEKDLNKVVKTLEILGNALSSIETVTIKKGINLPDFESPKPKKDYSTISKRLAN